MITKIKAGDKVKLLEKVYSHCTEGEILTVTEVCLSPEGDYQLWPIIVDGWAFGLDEVELVR